MQYFIVKYHNNLKIFQGFCFDRAISRHFYQDYKYDLYIVKFSSDSDILLSYLVDVPFKNELHVFCFFNELLLNSKFSYILFMR